MICRSQNYHCMYQIITFLANSAVLIALLRGWYFRNAVVTDSSVLHSTEQVSSTSLFTGILPLCNQILARLIPTNKSLSCFSHSVISCSLYKHTFSTPYFSKLLYISSRIQPTNHIQNHATTPIPSHSVSYPPYKRSIHPLPFNQHRHPIDTRPSFLCRASRSRQRSIFLNLVFIIFQFFCRWPGRLDYLAD